MVLLNAHLGCLTCQDTNEGRVVTQLKDGLCRENSKLSGFSVGLLLRGCDRTAERMTGRRKRARRTGASLSRQARVTATRYARLGIG